MMNGENDKKRSRHDASDFRGCGGDSDLNILIRMLDGLGVETPHAAAIRMLERFGSFGGVFAATEAELEDTGLSSRVASFFAFVDPALRRVNAGSGVNEAIVDERAALKHALALIGRQYKLGYYAVYIDGVGRKIYSEFLGGESALGDAAIGACRHKTRKLLLVCVRSDGEVTELKANRAAELTELLRLLEILEIEFVDLIETDGNEFFSLRRALTLGCGVASVFDASDTPFTGMDLKRCVQEYAAKKRAAAKR